jgi:hypothetical protein
MLVEDGEKDRKESKISWDNNKEGINGEIRTV